MPSSSPTLNGQALKSQHGTMRMESSVLIGGKSKGTRIAVQDALLGLERRERAIQKELQTLLDAQSSGLLAGLDPGVAGETSSGSGPVVQNWEGRSSVSGSSTPTTNRVNEEPRNGARNSGVVPVRQPKSKPISLRGARKGLLRDIGHLAAIKGEEIGVLTGDIERRERVLGQVRVWEQRIESVRAELEDYASGSHSRRSEESLEVENLKQEETAVDAEIRELEERLSQMRARKKWLGEKIREGTNKREARLSSYRGALRQVEGEVREFLKRPPVGMSSVMEGEEGFLALPSHRRTLGMASEWWGKEARELEKRRQEVEKEKGALEEGQQVWEGSIGLVTQFEEELMREMSEGDGQDEGMLRRQVGRMGEVIQKLEQNVKLAEQQGWNLLICAIGAELAAFKEGEGILRAALETSERGQASQEYHDAWDHEEVADEVNHGIASHGVGDLGEEQEDKHRQSLDREDSEDDGPNLAELLIDHGAEDTS